MKEEMDTDQRLQRWQARMAGKAILDAWNNNELLVMMIIIKGVLEVHDGIRVWDRIEMIKWARGRFNIDLVDAKNLVDEIKNHFVYSFASKGWTLWEGPDVLTGDSFDEDGNYLPPKSNSPVL